MLADLRLVISPTETRLVLRNDDDIVEDELWKHEKKVSRTEAKSASRAAFDCIYDFMNHAIHGEHGD